MAGRGGSEPGGEQDWALTCGPCKLHLLGLSFIGRGGLGVRLRV
jgi:hypothetical protein